MPLQDFMRPHARARLWCLALGATLLSCTALRAPLPSTSPFIRGTITSRCLVDCSLGYLIVADPSRSFEYDSAWVKVFPETRLAYPDGRSAPVGALEVGTRVSVWTTRIINESRPVQVTATVVVVERGGES